MWFQVVLPNGEALGIGTGHKLYNYLNSIGLPQKPGEKIQLLWALAHIPEYAQISKHLFIIIFEACTALKVSYTLQLLLISSDDLRW